jgi:hypothetical protein
VAGSSAAPGPATAGTAAHAAAHDLLAQPLRRDSEGTSSTARARPVPGDRLPHWQPAIGARQLDAGTELRTFLTASVATGIGSNHVRTPRCSFWPRLALIRPVGKAW